LDFLQALDMREDTLPGDATRGELVFYQLGKFSQVISDYEQIHFTTEPKAKYEGFAKWLEHQAPGYYADADADGGYATPDAVAIATVHQSKGLQWPAVFLPALRKNRFPSRVMGGVTLRHVIPDDAIDDPARYRGTVEDETRLLYVAVTRAQKYLYVTFAPVADNQQQRARSDFFNHIAAQQWVSTAPAPINQARLTPQPVQATPQVTLSFSELKHLFVCSYEFKLRFLYGFNAPKSEFRCMSPRASPSTAASTSFDGWTPERSRSSISSPRTALRQKTSPATNSTCTPWDTRNSPGNPQT